MNILITAGGTSERIDDVRSITNKSTGKLGASIAEAYRKKQPNAQIHYVCSSAAVIPDIDNLHVYKIVSVADVCDRLSLLFEKLSFDIIVHAMAVSDYTSNGVLSVQKLTASLSKLSTYEYSTVYKTISSANDLDLIDVKKIDSDQANLILILKRTPKIISQIRAAQPNCVLVGFKLLVDVSRSTLLDAAYTLLEKNRCDIVFANDIMDVHDYSSHKGILVKPDKSFTETSSKPETAEAISSVSLMLLEKREG